MVSKNQEVHGVAVPLDSWTAGGMSAAQVAAAVIEIWNLIDDGLTPVLGGRGLVALYQRTLFLTAQDCGDLTGLPEARQELLLEPRALEVVEAGEAHGDDEGLLAEMEDHGQAPTIGGVEDQLGAGAAERPHGLDRAQVVGHRLGIELLSGPGLEQEAHAILMDAAGAGDDHVLHQRPLLFHRLDRRRQGDGEQRGQPMRCGHWSSAARRSPSSPTR